MFCPFVSYNSLRVSVKIVDYVWDLVWVDIYSMSIWLVFFMHRDFFAIIYCYIIWLLSKRIVYVLICRKHTLNYIICLAFVSVTKTNKKYLDKYKETSVSIKGTHNLQQLFNLLNTDGRKSTTFYFVFQMVYLIPTCKVYLTLTCKSFITATQNAAYMSYTQIKRVWSMIRTLAVRHGKRSNHSGSGSDGISHLHLWGDDGVRVQVCDVSDGRLRQQLAVSVSWSWVSDTLISKVADSPLPVFSISSRRD